MGSGEFNIELRTGFNVGNLDSPNPTSYTELTVREFHAVFRCIFLVFFLC